MSWNKKIFRKNDIRGIYLKDFDLDFVSNLAQSFVNFYFPKSKKKPFIAIAHDSRLSSPEIALHLSQSLALSGANVHFLGMQASPVCFFSAFSIPKIQASIMVTASHNPADFNGFKLSINKETLCDQKLLKLKRFIIKQNLPSTINTLSSTKGTIHKFNIQNNYSSFYTKQFLPPLQKILSSLPSKNKKLSITIDCGNGSSGPIAQKIFQTLKLPIKIHWLYTKPDGRFPYHHPDPSLEINLQDLKTNMKKNNCDFGVAFDGDGDRLVIVEKGGKTLQGDELMSIFISDILAELKKQKKGIVADVKCGDWFFHFLKKNKIPTTMWKSGHSLIREKTLQKQALFGGELSGHYFFCDEYFPIDDGVYALLRLIKICFKTGKTPKELKIKKSYIETSEIRINTNHYTQAKKQINKLKLFYQNHKNKNIRCSFIDGVRVSLPNLSWGLARLSNTQNEWTFRFGAKNQKDLKKLQAKFYQLLNIKY